MTGSYDRHDIKCSGTVDNETISGVLDKVWTSHVRMLSAPAIISTVKKRGESLVQSINQFSQTVFAQHSSIRLQCPWTM